MYIDGAGSDAALATNWMPADVRVERRADHRAAQPADHRGTDSDSAKYQYYETRDGKFVIFCGIEHKFWDAFCRAVGREDLLGSKDTSALRSTSQPSRLDLRRELQEIFHTADAPRSGCRSGPRARHRHGTGAPASRTCSSDPHLARARDPAPRASTRTRGEFVSVGWPAPVRGQPFGIERPAPRLGEHTEELLAELGYAGARVAELREQGVV